MGGLQADLELLDSAGPAAFFGLGDAFGEAAGDRLQPAELRWVDAQNGAADAGVLVFAGSLCRIVRAA